MHTNIPVVGIVYHVVQKDTGKVIKVGSTVQPLEKRARGYRKKYSDCFLREAFAIESSTADDNWFGLAGIHQPKKAFCPFLWNLIIAEHLEMLRMGTYRIVGEPRSNQQFPIYQKLDGFDGADACAIGGHISGPVNGRKNVENGFLLSIAAKGGRIGGLHKNRDNQARAARLTGKLYGHRFTPEERARGRNNISRESHVRAGQIRFELYGSPSTIEGSRKGGRTCAERRLGACGRSKEQMTRDGRKGGMIGGRNGSREDHARAARIGHHNRHVRRGISKPGCAFCEAAQLKSAA